MGNEDKLAALQLTLKALPENQRNAVTLLATDAKIADAINTQLRAEMGSVGAMALTYTDKATGKVVTGAPELAGKAKNWANGTDTVDESLMKAIKAAVADPTKNIAGLAKAVAAVTGMSEPDATRDLEKARQSGLVKGSDIIKSDAQKDAAKAEADIYANLQLKIKQTMGGVVKNAADAQAKIDPSQFLLTPKAYTPPPLDPKLEAAIKSEIDVRGITDEHKTAVLTIVKNSPEHAANILKNIKEFKQDAMSHLGTPSDAAKTKLVDAFRSAAVDYSKNTGGQDENVIGALDTLSAMAGRKVTREKIRADVHMAAVGLQTVEDNAINGRNDPEEELKRRRAAEARNLQEQGEKNVGDDIFSGIIKLVVTMIAGFFGIEKAKIDKLFGDDKPTGPAADATKPAGKPVAEQTPVPGTVEGLPGKGFKVAGMPSPAPVLGSTGTGGPNPADTPRVADGATPPTVPTAEAPAYLTEIDVKGTNQKITARELQGALIKLGAQIEADGKAGPKTAAALIQLRQNGSHAGDTNLVVHADEVKQILALSQAYEKDLAQKLAQGKTAPAPSASAPHQESSDRQKGRGPQNIVPSPQAATTVEINDGHGHTVKADAALLAKVNPATLTMIEKLTGGEKENGAILDVAGFEKRLAMVNQQFNDQPTRVRGNPNPPLETKLAILDRLNDQRESQQNLQLNLLAAVTGDLTVLKGGQDAQRGLNTYQDKKGLTHGGFDGATMAKLTADLENRTGTLGSLESRASSLVASMQKNQPVQGTHSAQGSNNGSRSLAANGSEQALTVDAKLAEKVNPKFALQVARAAGFNEGVVNSENFPLLEAKVKSRYLEINPERAGRNGMTGIGTREMVASLLKVEPAEDNRAPIVAKAQPVERQTPTMARNYSQPAAEPESRIAQDIGEKGIRELAASLTRNGKLRDTKTAFGDVKIALEGALGASAKQDGKLTDAELYKALAMVSQANGTNVMSLQASLKSGGKSYDISDVKPLPQVTTEAQLKPSLSGKGSISI